jgi:hypothetical protein
MVPDSWAGFCKVSELKRNELCLNDQNSAEN